ncbi:MAG: RNA 2',3'-cyclic phosphodiesterase [Rhodoblastus sp.]|nr:MAG: RNA 2',3'-cyclic phosphodiesterase [Rhodoblastus sp.]
MPRLFAALEIPDDLAADLATLRGGLFGARWVEEEDLHLTLRFFGDIDERLAEEIEGELADIRKPSFAVTLERLDWFGGDRPRAIIVKAKASPELVALQSKIETAMRRLGAPPEPRKFAPHVTLARLRGASVAGVADYLSARSFFASRRFVAHRFALFSAREAVGGGPYVVERAFPLAAA